MFELSGLNHVWNLLLCFESDKVGCSDLYRNLNPGLFRNSVYGDDKNIDNFMEHVADVGQGLIFSFERIRPMPPSEQQQIEETLGEVDSSGCACVLTYVISCSVTAFHLVRWSQGGGCGDKSFGVLPSEDGGTPILTNHS